MAFTNSGLVTYCKNALKLKTKYMWGGLMREITDNYINQLSGPTMYPQQYPESRKAVLRSCIGKGYYGCDCVGLIKSYYFGGVGTAKNAKGYDGSKDYGVGKMYIAAKAKGTVGTMYHAAKTKGKIATMPQSEGILVMTANFGHVGVYVGNGQVIECTLHGSKDGVVQTAFSAGSWAYWCQCPCIEDDTGANVAAPKVENCNKIYRSLGVAAKRKGASNSATQAGRCERGAYYLASQIVTAPDGRKWFRHLGTDLYSALTDTLESGGGKLFEEFGTYSSGK